MFTDLVGSTALLTRLGEDAFHDVRAEHDRLLTDAVTRHAGTVVKHGGDGIMASFGSASDAVAAAVRAQQDIAAHNQRGEPLGVRIGISAGDVRTEDGDLFGTPVVEAARLCAAADGGHILVADIVRILAGAHGTVAFADGGTRELAGLPTPLQTWLVGWQPRRASSVPLPAQLRFETPFVGRADSRVALDTAWGRAIGGDHCAVFVAGEPGIGKTRLVAEHAAAVHADGAVVLFGRCDEEIGGPYQPFAEAIRRHAESLDDTLVASVADHDAQAIALLLPDLAERLGRPEAGAIEPDSVRERIFAAVAAWLRMASRDQPLLLVVDDVHWAARSTLLLLRHLVRAEIGNTLIAATYRTTDLDRTHPLAELLADFRREPNVARIGLDGLDGDDVASFLEAAAGHDLDDAGRSFAAQVAHDTGGNPFFVTAVLANLVESGTLQRGDDDRWQPSIDPAHVEIPEGVREVVGQRLTRLGPDANRVLHHAAVLGAEFDLGVLDRLPDLPGDPLDAIEAANAIGVVREVGPGRWAFSHAIVRRTLLDELSTTRQTRIHRDIYRALSMGPPSPDALAAVAHHALAAAPLVEVPTAIGAANAAADDAMDRAAWEEAVGIAQRALELLDNHPDDELRFDILRRRGFCYSALLQPLRWRDTALEMIEVARRIGDPDRLEVAVTGGSIDPLDLDPRLLAMAQEVLDELGDEPSVARSVFSALLVVARTLGLQAGDPSAITAVHDHHAHASLDALVSICVSRGFAGWCQPDPHTCRRVADEIAAILRAPNSDQRTSLYAVRLNRENVGIADYLRHITALRTGAMDQWRVSREQMRLNAESDGTRLLLAAAAQLDVTELLLTGRLAGIEPMITCAASLVPEAPSFAGGQLLQEEWLAILRGDAAADAMEAISVMFGVLPVSHLVPHRTAWRLHLFGDDDAARAELQDDALDRAIRCDPNWLCTGTLWRTADLTVWRNDAPRARAVHERLTPYDGQLLVDVCTHVVGSTAATLAHLEAFLGEHDAADAHFREAIAFEEQAGARTLLARTLYRYGRFTGDAVHTDRAWALAREIGLGEAYLTR